MIKPRIRKSYYAGGWICVSKGCVGQGDTPARAYGSWLNAHVKMCNPVAYIA